MNLPSPSPEAIAALAPTGTLRAAINTSNFLLVTGEADDGAPTGVSPDMAIALGRQLGVPVELLRYGSPAAVADDGGSGNWDIGNIGAEPKRAEFIDFTAAYAEIEATYMVRAGSTITSLDEVDIAGRTVVCKARSAYGLWLERNLEQAELVQVPSHDDAFRTWIEDDVEVLGALRPWLIDVVGQVPDVDGAPGARILDGRFTAVQQAVGTPKGRAPEGFAYLRRFVEAAKAEGVVAASIEAHGVVGLSVAPASD